MIRCRRLGRVLAAVSPSADEDVAVMPDEATEVLLGPLVRRNQADMLEGRNVLCVASGGVCISSLALTHHCAATNA
eukprot:COSAG03_NODE_116_length_12390_cov_34.697258_9_plen_76_part_00